MSSKTQREGQGRDHTGSHARGSQSGKERRFDARSWALCYSRELSVQRLERLPQGLGVSSSRLGPCVLRAAQRVDLPSGQTRGEDRTRGHLADFSRLLCRGDCSARSCPVPSKRFPPARRPGLGAWPETTLVSIQLGYLLAGQVLEPQFLHL